MDAKVEVEPLLEWELYKLDIEGMDCKVALDPDFLRASTGLCGMVMFYAKIIVSEDGAVWVDSLQTRATNRNGNVLYRWKLELELEFTVEQGHDADVRSWEMGNFAKRENAWSLTFFLR